ncbi:hypothetical protein M125_2463, partial [Bacteroides fragilis str. 3998T(B)3]
MENTIAKINLFFRFTKLRFYFNCNHESNALY